MNQHTLEGTCNNFFSNQSTQPQHPKYHLNLKFQYTSAIEQPTDDIQVQTIPFHSLQTEDVTTKAGKSKVNNILVHEHHTTFLQSKQQKLKLQA